MKISKALLVIIFVSFLFTLPFFKDGYFQTHDGEWAIIRLAEMGREIRDLQIPPRWSSFLNHGYGYPLFLFTYPLPFYLGYLISLVGVGLTSSIKLVFVLTVFAWKL